MNNDIDLLNVIYSIEDDALISGAKLKAIVDIIYKYFNARVESVQGLNDLKIKAIQLAHEIENRKQVGVKSNDSVSI